MPPQDISGKGWTPGPWHVGGKDTVPIIYGPDGFAVADATVFHGTFKEGQTGANARLIAAAPAMADALDGLLRLWDSFTENGEGWGNHEEAYHAFAKGRSAAWESARAALSLAHGEQP